MNARWRSPQRSGFAAAARVALTIALSIEIAYLLIANVIIGAWLPRWINADEQALKIGYESAWSPWPGRIYAKNLLLRFQDANVEFELRINDLEADVALTSLLRHTFRATHVDADGVKFRFRHKLSAPAEHPAMVRALPPIEGFPSPPLLVEAAPESHGKLWTIDLSGVDARVDELWIQQFRSPGAGHATGRFRLEPRRRLRVEAGLLLEPGPLYAGPNERVARDFSAHITTSIEDMDLERLTGKGVFQEISGRVHLNAELEDLDFLDTLIEPEQVVIREGAGPIAIDAQLDHGELLQASSVRYSARRLEVYASHQRLHGDAELRLEVTRENRGRLLLSASSLAWSDTWARVGVPVVAERPRLELETHAPALHRRFEASGGLLDVPRIRAEDLRSLERVAPQKLKLRGGSAIGSAHAELEAHGALRGRVKLSFEGARCSWDGVAIDATGNFEMSLRKPDVLGKKGALESATVTIERGHLRTRDGDTGFGWLRASSKSVPLSGLVPERATIQLSAGFPDAKPVMEALGIEPQGLAGTAAGVLDLSDLEVGAVLGVDRDGIDVGLERARTDAVRARGRWVRVRGNDRGAFLLMTDLVNFGLEINDGETRLRPLASQGWLERALAELGRDTRFERESSLRPAPARVMP